MKYTIIFVLTILLFAASFFMPVISAFQGLGHEFVAGVLFNISGIRSFGGFMQWALVFIPNVITLVLIVSYFVRIRLFVVILGLSGYLICLYWGVMGVCGLGIRMGYVYWNIGQLGILISVYFKWKNVYRKRPAGDNDTTPASS